jgi:hypothetical protein
MLKSMLAFLLLASFPTVGAFGSVLTQDQKASDFTVAGCGPGDAQFNVKTNKKDHALPQPGSDKAAIVVLTNPGVCIGPCPTMRIGIDGTWVGANKGKSYLFSLVDPGNHHVCVALQSSIKHFAKPMGALSIQAEAGGSYYFTVFISRHGGWVFEPIDSAAGALQVASTAHSTATEKGASTGGAGKPGRSPVF